MNKLFDVVRLPLLYNWDLKDDEKEKLKEIKGYYEPTNNEYFDALSDCYHKFKDLNYPGIPVYLSTSGSPEDYENNLEHLVGYWEFGKLILNGNVNLRKFVKKFENSLALGYNAECEDKNEDGKLVGFKIKSLCILSINGFNVNDEPELFKDENESLD